jgi:hypothetical protein
MRRRTMKNKTVIFIFSLIAFASICFTTCNITNPVIEKWWVEEEEPEEPEYIALFKYVPINYDTIIEEKIVYETIFVQLPPETIIEYIYEQLPPEIIYEVIEVITTVTEYVDVYVEIETIIEIQTPPNKETIIEWLKDPANQEDVKEIIKIIKDEISEEKFKEIIKEIIKEIPPKDIMEYLTDEQIKYIVSQQPAKMILQSIRIIGIEYVIFAGDSFTVNGTAVAPATTQLTAQEKAYNTSTIGYMAQLLKDNPAYIIMLHGHANPTTFTDGEKSELTALSNNRANDVRRVLMSEYNKLDGQSASYENPNLTDRVSCSGYGGEKTLFGNNTTYTALNRRVEMILFEIVTTVVDG